MKMIGFEARQGEFENAQGKLIAYDNFLLHMTQKFGPDRGEGIETSVLKLKRADFKAWTGYESPALLIGKEIDLDYTLSGGKPLLCGLSVKA